MSYPNRWIAMCVWSFLMGAFVGEGHHILSAALPTVAVAWLLFGRTKTSKPR